MIFQEENQLLQHIKLGHLYRVYLLYGEEKYLKELYLKRLVRLASPEQFEEFNFHRFDGGELEVDRLIEACESLPFLAGQRCVVVEKFDFEGMPAADREKLTRLLEDPPETTVLILVVDKEDFSAKKSAGAKKLIALCDKEFESVSSHVYGIDSDMNQNFHSICKRQTACVSGIRHDNTDFSVCRSNYSRIGWLDCHTVSHYFL